MLMKEVIETYNDMVSFPWTPAKIRKAGFAVRPFLISIAEALSECEDSDTPTAVGLFALIERMKGGNKQAENFQVELG